MEKGALLAWNPGRPSTVAECSPPHLLDWSDESAGMVIHRYFKLSQEGHTTTVVYGVSVKGASLPPGGEAERRK